MTLSQVGCFLKLDTPRSVACAAGLAVDKRSCNSVSCYKEFDRIAVVRTEYAAARKDFVRKPGADRIAVGNTSVDRTVAAAYMASYTEFVHTKTGYTAFPELERMLLQRIQFENTAYPKKDLRFQTAAGRRMRTVKQLPN